MLGPIRRMPLVPSDLISRALEFTAANEASKGQYWMSLLPGQTFKGNGQKLQYCFVEQLTAGLGGFATEQTPFEVHSLSDKKVEFCYRVTADPLPTMKAGCTSCDCARITIAPQEDGK